MSSNNNLQARLNYLIFAPVASGILSIIGSSLLLLTLYRTWLGFQRRRSGRKTSRSNERTYNDDHQYDVNHHHYQQQSQEFVNTNNNVSSSLLLQQQQMKSSSIDIHDETDSDAVPLPLSSKSNKNVHISSGEIDSVQIDPSSLSQKQQQQEQQLEQHHRNSTESSQNFLAKSLSKLSSTFRQGSTTTTTTSSGSTPHSSRNDHDRSSQRRFTMSRGSNRSTTAATKNSNSNNKFTTYHRLLIGAASFDIIFSIGMALGPLPIPKDQGYPYSTVGNTATCTFQGFLLTLGQGGLAYSTSLMIYFYLLIVVRGNMKGTRSSSTTNNMNCLVFLRDEDSIARYVEPWLHAWCLLVHSSIAIAGLFLQVYNPNGARRCWIAEYPINCGKSFVAGNIDSNVYSDSSSSDSNDDNDENGNGRTNVTSESLNINDNPQWGINGTNSSSIGGTVYTTTGVMDDKTSDDINNVIPCTRANEEMENLFGFWLRTFPLCVYTFLNVILLGLIAFTVWRQYRRQQRYQHQFLTQSRNDNSRNCLSVIRKYWKSQDRRENTTNGLASNEQASDQQRIIAETDARSMNQQSTHEIASTRTAMRSATSRSQPSQAKRQMKLVVSQCFLYGFVFVNTTIWGFTISINISLFDRSFDLLGDDYWLSAMNSTFLPLQGFFLFLIFIRPRYLAVRQEQTKREQRRERIAMTNQATMSPQHQEEQKEQDPSFHHHGDSTHATSTENTTSAATESPTNPGRFFFGPSSRWNAFWTALLYPLPEDQRRRSGTGQHR